MAVERLTIRGDRFRQAARPGQGETQIVVWIAITWSEADDLGKTTNRLVASSLLQIITAELIPRRSILLINGEGVSKERFTVLPIG